MKRRDFLAASVGAAAIASVLEEIATLLELKGENPFKVRAYTNAARAIETFGANVTNFQDEEAVAKIPGIGRASQKTKELPDRIALLDRREVGKNYRLQLQRAMESSAGRRPIPHEGMI